MSDWRDITGQEIKGPVHAVADLFATGIVKGRQKKALREQKQFQKEQERQQRRMWRQQRRQQRQSVRPETKSLRRALCGAAFLTACLWLGPVIWQAHNAPHGEWVLTAWGFIAVAALVALLVGLKETRAYVPPSLMRAFWSGSVLLVIAALFIKRIYPPDDLAGYAVRFVYVTAAAVLLVYFWIASGLQQARARWIIKRQLKRRNAPLAAPRRRRWFFFFW